MIIGDAGNEQKRFPNSPLFVAIEAYPFEVCRESLRCRNRIRAKERREGGRIAQQRRIGFCFASLVSAAGNEGMAANLQDLLQLGGVSSKLAPVAQVETGVQRNADELAVGILKKDADGRSRLRDFQSVIEMPKEKQRV